MQHLFATSAEKDRPDDRWCGVADTGRNGRSCQPPAEDSHEQPVQRHVQNAAQHIEKRAQSGFSDSDKAELKHHAEYRKQDGGQHRDHVFPAVVRQGVIRAEEPAERI